MKQVREQSDSSAYVVLNKKGEEVATVQLRHGSGGGVQCDVWSRKPGEKHLSLTHQKKAGGYNYDKRTAAMAGAMIEGFMIANHCGSVEPAGEKKRAALMRAYIKACAAGMTNEEERAWSKKAEKIGCRFANYSRADGTPVGPDGKGYRYTSLNNESGLGRLEMMGFRVICAL